jgi:hypothetical protein
MGKRSTIPTTDAEAAALTVSESNQQTAFAKHQSWPMVKPVLFAALVCAAPVCRSSAQEAKIAIDMMGIGGMSSSGQTETKVDTAAVVVEVKKTCAQRPSQVLANAVWTAYLDVNKR